MLYYFRMQYSFQDYGSSSHLLNAGEKNISASFFIYLVVTLKSQIVFQFTKRMRKKENFQDMICFGVGCP